MHSHRCDSCNEYSKCSLTCAVARVHRVEQCIAWCHEYGVRDGEAYLLEHYLGDYNAAMQLHVTNIDECARCSISLSFHVDPSVRDASCTPPRGA